MRGHAHRQQHRALGAAGLGGIDRTRHRRRIAGDDGLAGRIEIHGFDHFALRRFPAGRVEIRVLEPEDRRHRTLPQRHGLLHHLAAEADDVDGRLEVHGVGAHQRGVFTEAVSRHRHGPRPAATDPDPPRRDPGRQHRRLRALRGAELGLGPVLAERPEVVAEHVARFGKGGTHDGLRRAEFGEHADGLGPLPRKDESECHRQCSPVGRPAANPDAVRRL